MLNLNSIILATKQSQVLADFYEKMISWEKIDGSSIYDFMDFGSDISANVSEVVK